MTTTEILTMLQRDIHTAVFATVDEQGLPQTCVIDLMLADENGLYFLTAKGKAFYDRLMARRFVAISGMKGEDTLSSIAISVRGRVRPIGRERLAEIFEKNPYMAKIYSTEKSREALVVFHLDQGEGEYFDLSQLPPFRQSFGFGGGNAQQSGYRIRVEKCIGCQGCLSVCPTGCISRTVPRVIDESHCLHCGNCLNICPVGAVERHTGEQGENR
ncbi:MAG: 4Fe-4S binding protein [Clostridia bacterium]|nr:4Fe-4S binding protein [Clostridia bacterium]